jgi:hypothetical protein
VLDEKLNYIHNNPVAEGFILLLIYGCYATVLKGRVETFFCFKLFLVPLWKPLFISFSGGGKSIDTFYQKDQYFLPKGSMLFTERINAFF